MITNVICNTHSWLQGLDVACGAQLADPQSGCLHSLHGETESLLQSSHTTLYDVGTSPTGMFSTAASSEAEKGQSVKGKSETLMSAVSLGWGLY